MICRARRASVQLLAHYLKPAGGWRLDFTHHTRRQHTKSCILDVLEERGLVNQIAGDRGVLAHHLQSKKIALYSGFDPTAPSLHLGHLLPLIVLFWLHNYGHHAISLVGGGTARVGDPSGRLVSRAKINHSTYENNVKSMHDQLFKLWNHACVYSERRGFDPAARGKAEILDNSAWLKTLNILDFLDVLGSGMRMGTMLGKDTVRNKMERGDGMSYAEFSYPLLQGWDWWHMYQESKVVLQIGGGDQYGNIVAGTEAVRYAAQHSAHDTKCAEWFDEKGKLRSEHVPMGMTVPLLTTASGEKFGKSAGNAIWLDENLTSAFDLYGFLLSSADLDVERYLRLFTFLPVTHISAVMAEHQSNPERRKAQRLLADEVLELVHGPEMAVAARASHERLRAPTLANLQTSTSLSSEQSERIRLSLSEMKDSTFPAVLHQAGIAATRSEGARMVAQGGVYVATSARSTSLTTGNTLDELHFEKIEPKQIRIPSEYILDGVLVLRIGKWKVRIIEVDNGENPARVPRVR